MEDVSPTTPGPPEPPVLTTAWDRIFDWARRLGVRPVRLGLGCCAFEMLPGLDPRHDLARFGPETFRATPGKSDLLVVAGPVSRKMAPLVRRIWDEMPGPKWSIALGDCGGSWSTYAVTRLETVIPVDIHVPGCPPGPEALLDALFQLEKKIRPEAAP